MSVGTDTLLGRAQVEMFPTTIGLTPDGALAFVANSDFHGDHPRLNVVTIVQTATMTPLTNLPACDMPHGVKANHAGTLVYVSCMNSDEILEIDRQSFRIRRRHKTGEGMPGAGMPMHAVASGPPRHDCMPTFVSVSPDDRRLYVACNHGNTLQVLDAGSLELVQEIPVGTGAYIVGDWRYRNYGITYERNPNYHGDTYPTRGESGDKVRRVLLADRGSPRRSMPE